MKFLLATISMLLLMHPLRAQQQDSALVWPQPPERPRIKYIRTIRSLETSEDKKGIFEKIIGLFAGRDQSVERMVQPVGIAVSNDGRIFIADPGAKGLHVIDASGEKCEFISGSRVGGLLSPVGVAISPGGVVYVSDSQLGKIVVLDRDLNEKKSIKERLLRPTGLSIKNNRLYVTDTGKHAVLIFDLQGTYLAEFGQRGAGGGEFNFPISLASGGDSLFVVDALNYRVQEFDTSGKFLATFGQQGNIAGRFASPKSIALDSDRNLYVTDALMDNMQIFSPAGELQLIFGHAGTRNGEFGSPGGIAIGKDDRIYVVETLNRRIQVFQYLR